MKTTKLILTLISLLVFEISYSQLNDFNLSDYKLPVIDRRALETDFNLAADNNYNKSPSNIFFGSPGGGQGINQFNGMILMNYNHYQNKSRFQRESNIGLNFLSGFNNRKNEKKLFHKYSNLSPSLNYQRENRIYYQKNNFYETDFYLSYQFYKYKNYENYDFDGLDDEEKLLTHSLLAFVPLKYGIGRIEQVQDARHSIYLFEELIKSERVSAGKSNEEIIEFAELISKLKNKRFFDSRLRRMEELESVDSFLVSKDYLLKSDSRYFTTLADFWDYGNRPLRNSGTRFSVGISPGYFLYNYNTKESGLHLEAGKFNLSALLLDGGFELKHEKPYNLFWQNSVNLNASIGIIEGNLSDKINSIENKIRIPNVNLGFYHRIGYYPNTRTDAGFTYSVQYIQLFDKTDNADKIVGVDGKGVKVSTDLSINYYFSPKLRLNITSYFYYIWQDSKDEVIINFDNPAGSDYLLSSFSPIPNYSMNFRSKDLVNSVRIRLIYSIF